MNRPQVYYSISGGVRLINLTPHDVVILNNNGDKIVIPKSEETLRVSSETKIKDYIKVIDKDSLVSIPISETKFSGISSIPERKENTFYIVSLLTCQACPDRDDFFIPNESVRDENGVIIGCKSLSINPFFKKNNGGEKE